MPTWLTKDSRYDHMLRCLEFASEKPESSNKRGNPTREFHTQNSTANSSFARIAWTQGNTCGQQTFHQKGVGWIVQWQNGLKEASRGLEGGFKGAWRGLEAFSAKGASRMLQGASRGFKGASRGLQGGLKPSALKGASRMLEGGFKGAWRGLRGGFKFNLEFRLNPTPRVCHWILLVVVPRWQEIIFIFSFVVVVVVVVGCWLLVVGCWLLVVGCWLFVVGCWLLVVCCLLFVVCCLLFVVRSLWLKPRLLKAGWSRKVGKRSLHWTRWLWSWQSDTLGHSGSYRTPSRGSLWTLSRKDGVGWSCWSSYCPICRPGPDQGGTSIPDAALLCNG